MIEEATFTFRTYRIASVITALKLRAAADETKQNEFLDLFSFSLRVHSFGSILAILIPV